MDLNRSASSIRPNPNYHFTCKTCSGELGRNYNICNYCPACLRASKTAHILGKAVGDMVAILVRTYKGPDFEPLYYVFTCEATETAVSNFLEHLEYDCHPETEAIGITSAVLKHLPYETPIEVVNLIKCAFNADGSVVNIPL